jgi:Tfp pilus assembly protein PilN
VAQARRARSRTRHFLILGTAHGIEGAADALQTLVRLTPQWLEQWDRIKAEHLAARRGKRMTTDETITRLAEQATARDQAMKAADEAPLQRIRDDLAPAIAAAMAAVDHAKPAAVGLPELHRAFSVLSRPAYRRVRGVDLVLNGYPKQKVVDEAREAVRNLIRTLEEHPKQIERVVARIRAVSTSDLAWVNSPPASAGTWSWSRTD